MTKKVPTGVRRLDDLLDGGLLPGSATLVHGPPFIGKRTLTRLWLLEAWRQGVPAVLVLTSEAASDVRRTLLEFDPAYSEYEKAGLCHYVDAYSRSIGAEDDVPFCEYVDGPVNLNGLSLAVNNAQRKIIADHAEHRLLVDSVSTLITYTNAQATFRFLQVLVGKARRAGATSLLVLESGMHPDPEVQTMKHLADGMLEMRTEHGNYLLQAVGLGLTEQRGWVEYAFTPTSFDVTGSFSAGRIR